MTKKKILYIIVGMAVAVALFLFWISGFFNSYLPFFLTTDGWNMHERAINAPQPESELLLVSATYISDQNTLSVVYDNVNNTVTFSYPDTGTTTLPVALSASGARYANEDESIVFWEHQETATVFKNGVEIFRGIKK